MRQCYKFSWQKHYLPVKTIFVGTVFPWKKMFFFPMLTLIRTKGVKQPLETLQVRPGPLKVNDDYQDQYFALLA